MIYKKYTAENLALFRSIYGCKPHNEGRNILTQAKRLVIPLFRIIFILFYTINVNDRGAGVIPGHGGVDLRKSNDFLITKEKPLGVN